MVNERQNYYDVPALSNSGMSKLNPAQGVSMKKYLHWQEEKKEAKEQTYFERGRLLHTAILEPDLYKVEDIERPSDNVCNIVNGLYSLYGGNALLPDPTVLKDKMLHLKVYNRVQEMAADIKYGQAWKPDTLYDKVRAEGEAYLKFLVSASDKFVITKKDKEIIDNCYLALQKHPVAQKLLFQDEQEKEKEIYLTYEDVKMKCKLDMYKCEESTITIRELKSTSMPVTLFPYSFTKFRYYRQSAVYGRIAAMEHYAKYNVPINRIIHEYIVVETQPPYEVMVYKIHPDWITYGTKEMLNILDYWKAGIDTFPVTDLLMLETPWPRGHSNLLNIR